MLADTLKRGRVRSTQSWPGTLVNTRRLGAFVFDMEAPRDFVPDEWTQTIIAPIVMLAMTTHKLRLRLFGNDPLDTIILSAILYGWLEGEPWNYERLVAHLGVTRNTVRNHVARLVEKGWVVERAVDHGGRLLPTKGVIAHAKRQRLDDLIPDIFRTAAQIRAAAGANFDEE
jgi:hypothetical protein